MAFWGIVSPSTAPEVTVLSQSLGTGTNQTGGSHALIFRSVCLESSSPASSRKELGVEGSEVVEGVVRIGID